MAFSRPDGDGPPPPRRARMRLRGALLDPGRRGARALGLAALLAVAATAIWVIVDQPAGGSAPIRGDAAPAYALGVAGATVAPGSSKAPDAAAPGPPGTPDAAAAGSLAAPDAGSPGAPMVLVHVAGLVASPGVYWLPDGARVADALDAAGGAAPEADLSTVNLARRVSDGEQIAIGVPGAADSVARPTASGAAGPGPTGPIDINTADAAALDALPGIGPVLAQRIVQWRAEHGRF
ncbi:MAG: SLBB domain-containing protein, partial [Frankiaceae bacterium]|nr:SLBB domain-containing protein [Frankiaceae bacterium]